MIDKNHGHKQYQSNYDNTAFYIKAPMMKFTLPRLMIVIISIVFTVANTALSADLNFARYYNTTAAVKVINWNKASVKNIPLLKAQRIEPQYRATLDTYFKQIAQLHGANKSSITEAKISRLHDTGRGGIIAQYTQKIAGVDVFGRTINVLINRKNEYVASSGTFTAIKKMPSIDYVLSDNDALAIGFKANTGEDIYLSSLVAQTKQSQFNKVEQQSFSNNFRLGENSRVKKVFFPLANNSVIPAYYIEVETSQIDVKESRLMSYVIDGISGKILFSNSLTSHVATTYKVFADVSGKNFPFDGPQGNALTPHPTGDINDTPNVGDTFVTPNIVTLDFGPISTSDPWLTDLDTTTTGNNVDAYADISGEDGFDAEDVRPEMTGANAFEYEFATFAAGLIGDAQKHAVVNLFYINNFLHDWFYDNGFNELAGNAQLSNYGRGGTEGDPLLVEAQDFSGADNANMSTPSDGGSPKMQMFIWTFLSDSRVEIPTITNLDSTTAIFGPHDYDVTATLSLVDDGTVPFGDGCEAITTDLTGLIAIIDRGGCNFTVKVKNAQDKGAVGVLMVNNVVDPIITMGGEDATVTIPSQMVSLPKGQEIKDALLANNSLQARLFNLPKPLDGTLDNGIVAHEWAHYLTNRLVGNGNGLNNNQGGSMGEGWSDFVALLMMVKESDNLIAGNNNYQGVYSASTFVGNAYFGIRRAPYSTDITKNALTFKHIEDGVALPLSHPVAFGSSGVHNSEVHASGEIWAEVLWEVFVGLINKPGYSFEQAREIMKDYLVAGLKMTPNTPTMLEAKDAFLSAVVANDSDDFIIARDAFTRRGMGASAIAPDRLSEDHSGVVEDFTPATAVQASISVDGSSFDIANCDIDGVLDVGETATLNMTFKNFSAGALPAFNANLTTTSDVTFSNPVLVVDPLAAFGDTVTKSFEITLNSATHMQEISISANVTEIGIAVDDFVEPADVSISFFTNFDFNKTLLNDDMHSVATSGFDWEVAADATVLPFAIQTEAWHGLDSAAAGASDLITPLIKVAAVGDFSLSFDHFYFFESSEDAAAVATNWDGGVIEVSVDGADWVDVIAFGATLSDPYNGTLSSFNGILGGREAYTATRDPNDLSMYPNTLTFADGLVNGHDIRIRFRIGTDANTGDFGWLIDNVVVTNAIEPMFSEIVSEDNFCLSGNSPVVNAGTDISIRATDMNNMTIDLIGSATDADGDPLTIQWAQRSGPEVVINNSGSAAANFTIAATAADINMVFELTASDNTSTISDSVNVQIQLNNAPTVTATGSTVTEGSNATLSATASDLDDDNLTYSWSQTSGTTVSLNNASTANPSFTAPQVSATSQLVFSVVVSDGYEDSAAASATVTVNNQQVQSSSGGGGGGSIPLPLLIILATFVGLSTAKRLTK